MLDGKDKCLDEQIKIFKKIVFKNKKLVNIIKVIDELKINNCYVGAGCVNQTVFNYYHGYDIDYGINDYDIIYFDDDTSYEAEDKVIKLINSRISDSTIRLDIKNQARVHMWFYEKYGIKREAYVSVEDAIGRWTSTVTCIGIRLINNKFEVYAPYGLNDLFNMIIRPVKIDIDKEFYYKRCIRWKNKWPNIKIISWDGDMYEGIDNRS